MREVVGSSPTATTISNPNFLTRFALMTRAELLHARLAVSAAGHRTNYALIIVEVFAGAK